MKTVPLGRRERKKQALRAKIVSDCCALIDKQGMEGTTLEALCEQVDISRKTFYNYFDSKDSLLLEICQSHLTAGIGAMVDGALASDASCAQQLDTIFDTLFQDRDKARRFDLELIDYLLSNFGKNRGESVGLLDEMIGHYTRFFTHHQGSLRSEYSPEFCGEMMTGMINAIILSWMNHPEDTASAKIPRVCNYIKNSMLLDEAGQAASKKPGEK